MVKLIPMTATEFDAFMEVSMRDQAQGQVQAGILRADKADEIILQQRQRFLPGDMATPNHHFFTIETEDSGKVGGLWYTVAEQDGERQLFVMDIQVYQPFRRRGYGTRAFKVMEAKAREMGISTISLHVFEHNHPARRMYKKLGFVGTDHRMSKKLA